MSVQRSTTLTDGEIMDSKNSSASPPKSAHSHSFVPLALNHTGTGQAKLTVACACGVYKHINATNVTDEDAKKD